MSNQFLKLRRSSVPGKIPTTSSLDFGEIALNTYDGLAFMKKSGSNGEEIVTLGGSTTGAFTGSFSGSFIGQFSGSFSGSGADLSNIPASAIVGLNLSQISSGSFSASISDQGLLVNTRVVATSFTGSLFGTSSWAQNARTASLALNAISSSFASTASFVQNAISASFAATASSADNFLVRGTLTAQTIIAQTITSSTDFVTGSTRFGSLLSNTHQFTGSVSVTGSLSVNNSPVILTNQTSSMSVLSASFASTASFVQNAISASFASTASFVNPLRQNVLITGSLFVSSSNPTQVLIGTSSLFVSSSGRVGLGTIAPLLPLDVRGRAIVSSTASLGPQAGFDNSTLEVYSNGTNAQLLIHEDSGSADAILYLRTGGNDYRIIGNSTALLLSVEGKADPALTISTGSGNVGIDIVSPTAKLHISGAITENLLIVSSSAGPALFVSGSGRVGIGTSNPVSTFNVVGTTNLTGDTVVTGSFTVVTGSSREFQVTPIGVNIGSIITDRHTITGSLFTTGSNTLVGNTSLTGSLNVTGSTIQIGNNTLLGNTSLSGSIIISGALGTQPTVRIFGDTTHNGYIRFDPVSTNIDQSISASYIYVSGSTNDLYFTQNGNGYNNTTRLRWLEGNLYTGLLNGGLLSITTGSTTFNLSSGSGIVVNLNASLTDNPYPTIKYVNWGNFVSQSLTFLTSSVQTFIGIDENGQITQQTSPFNNGEFNTRILIGTVLHQNKTTVNASITYPNVAYGYKQRTYDFVKAFGPLKLSGLTIIPSSSLGLTVGSGTAWSDGRNYQIDPNNPSYIVDPGTTVSKIFRYYQSGSSFVEDTNAGLGYTVIDPGNYNPGGSGSIQPVPGTGGNRQWSIQRVFWYPNSATKGIVVYYGNVAYASEIDAAANLPYEPFQEVENTKQNAVYLGALILRNDATFTDSTSYRILPGGLFRNVGGSGGGGNISTLLLSQLGDVSISGPTEAQALVYDSNLGKWKNSSFISASISGNAVTATTASFAISASQAQSASFVLNAVSSSFAATASSADNFLVRGTLTAQTIVAQTITSSTDFVTGSTRFGSLLSDTHQFTGSVSVTGSLSVNNVPIVAGTGSSGQVAFWTGSTGTQAGSSTFLFSPTTELDLANSVTASGAVARGARFRPTLVAAANNDVLVGLDINPAFTNGAFTGTTNAAIRLNANSSARPWEILHSGDSNILTIRNTSNINAPEFRVQAFTANFTLSTVFSLNTGLQTGFIRNPSATFLNFQSSGTGVIARLYDTGNLVLQNGGTFTDAGFRLDVNGTTRLQNTLTINAGGANITGDTVVTGSFTVVTGSARELQVTPTGVNIGSLITDVHTVTGSLRLSGSLTVGDSTVSAIYETRRITSTTAGVNVIYSLATSSYDGVFVDYTIRSGSVGRAGNFMAMWSGSQVDFTDNSINGFGATTGFVFGASISGSNMVVTGSGVTAGWNLKAIIRGV